MRENQQTFLQNSPLFSLKKIKTRIIFLLIFFIFSISTLAQQFPDANSILTVGSGGRSIKESALKEGDIIVSTTNETISEIIRKITTSPVSHAMVYAGNGMVIESIGRGVRLRTLEQATSGATIAVAFRYPNLRQDQQTRIVDFLNSQLGKKYNFVGLVRHPNFKVVDELCNSYAGNKANLCKNWLGKVVAGIEVLVDNKVISSKDEFFCSELVAAAYESAGLKIFSKPANTNPGEIPVIASFQVLQYVGHYKAPPNTISLFSIQNNALIATSITSNKLSNDSAFNAPKFLGNLEDLAVNESSGLAVSRFNKNLFWTHNDSGDGPYIYAFDNKGKKKGIWHVNNACSIDWEDIAIGPGPDKNKSYLYIGDIGDNSKNRKEIVVYRVLEPEVVDTNSSLTKIEPGQTELAEIIHLRYPDGQHDAESLLIHSQTGDLYIVTKVRGENTSGVYRAKAPLNLDTQITLVKVGEISLPNPNKSIDEETVRVTGADISPDGNHVALCSVNRGFELTLPQNSKSFDDIWKTSLEDVDIGIRIQGESIAYSPDGKILYTTSERTPTPFYEITRK